MARRSALKRVPDWPPDSPGTVNAWLLMVTTKPPTWRDNLVQWRDLPLALGDPPEGLFYPDPLGFWAEVRRWAAVIFQRAEPDWIASDALSLTALLHVGDDASRLATARQLMQPRVILFLDEPGWKLAGIDAVQQPHYIPDPYRQGQVYEGFWATLPDGTVVGKAPQHPATHKLYKAADMDGFLRAAPVSPED